jgi:hypothetical protein
LFRDGSGARGNIRLLIPEPVEALIVPRPLDRLLFPFLELRPPQQHTTFFFVEEPFFRVRLNFLRRLTAIFYSIDLIMQSSSVPDVGTDLLQRQKFGGNDFALRKSNLDNRDHYTVPGVHNNVMVVGTPEHTDRLALFHNMASPSTFKGIDPSSETYAAQISTQTRMIPHDIAYWNSIKGGLAPH